MSRSRRGLEVHRIEAAVLRSRGGPLKIEALELEGPRDDEVLVRIAASGICATDVHFRDEWYEGPDPVVLGHEGAGVVESVGNRVKGLRPGDPVVLSYQSCGLCGPCLGGRPTGCERFDDLNFGFRRLDGSNGLHRSGVRGHFFGQSSFATHALATERNLVPAPRDLPLELLAPLGCGLQTGAGTVLNSLQVSTGASIAVLGVGAVGLAAVMAAQIAGARPIVAVDVRPNRLRVAMELGATHAIDASREDVVARATGATGGGVDYAVETAGDPRTLELAVELLNPGGTAALLAGGSVRRPLPDGRRALGVIQGDAVPQSFIPKLIEFHRGGRFPFDRLIKFYGFAEINEAMDDAKRGDVIKPVLRMQP